MAARGAPPESAPGTRGGTPGAHGREAADDLLADHALMRECLLACIDRGWAAGVPPLVARLHFDTAERPERRNVAVVLGARGFLADPATRPRAAGDSRDADAPELFPAGGAPVAFDGRRWAARDPGECVARLAHRCVNLLAAYAAGNGGAVGGVAPALEAMVDRYRAGCARAHRELAAAVAGALAEHAVSAGEFLDVLERTERPGYRTLHRF